MKTLLLALWTIIAMVVLCLVLWPGTKPLLIWLDLLVVPAHGAELRTWTLYVDRPTDCTRVQEVKLVAVSIYDTETLIPTFICMDDVDATGGQTTTK